jgi:hypothetical protein
MNDRWEIEGMPGQGGCCGDGCGDNLCAECGKWNEEGLCHYCAMSLEELEFSLPLRILREEKKVMPCPNCNRDVDITVTYEQRIWRSDDHFNRKKTRQYQIIYAAENYSCVSSKYLFETNRHRTFREALLEAHKMLNRLGVK